MSPSNFRWSPSKGPSRLHLRLLLSSLATETLPFFFRIKEFSSPRGAPPQVSSFRPPAAWPTSGEVSVEGLSVRYGPNLPDVLHEVSFAIKAGEHVGVVGPTGSGKVSRSFLVVSTEQNRLDDDLSRLNFSRPSLLRSSASSRLQLARSCSMG